MYSLLDGVKQNHLNPLTFHIPSRMEIIALRVERHVKLRFGEPGKKGERMWVKITKISNDGEFEGLLGNDPFKLETIKYGDKVVFNSKHIINVY